MTACIRHVAVVGCIDHGKSTLVDSYRAQKPPTAAFATDPTLTLRTWGSCFTQLTYSDAELTQLLPNVELDENEQGMVINLHKAEDCCSPALWSADSALVVVDAVEGTIVPVGLERIIRNLMQLQVRPILVLNKIDRLLLELTLSGEEFWETIVRTISAVNVCVSTLRNDDVWNFDPVHGNVIFASGLQGWGFTLQTFVELYQAKGGLEATTTKLWTKNGFINHVFAPLSKLITTAAEPTDAQQNNVEGVNELLGKLGKELLPATSNTLKPRPFRKAAMQQVFPLHETLTTVVYLCCPPPEVAQKYRVANIYSGKADDKWATGMQRCDATGPTVIHILKTVAAADQLPVALGRVFSGTVRPDDLVTVMQPPPPTQLLRSHHLRPRPTRGKIISVVGLAENSEPLSSASAGDMVGIVGLELEPMALLIAASDNLADFGGFQRIPDTQQSVFVTVGVTVENRADVPKLHQAFRTFAKSDPLVTVEHEEGSDIYYITCHGDLHLKVTLKDLQEYAGGIEFEVIGPLVPLRESVAPSTGVPTAVTGSSSNKHNEMVVNCSRLDDSVVKILDSPCFGYPDWTMEQKHQHLLASTAEKWDVKSAEQLCAFSPPDDPSNCLLDSTEGVAHLQEAKQSVVQGLQAACERGVLCGEPLRGVKFELLDAKFAEEQQQRTPKQLCAMATKTFTAAQLAGTPVIQEPMYLVEMQTYNSNWQLPDLYSNAYTAVGAHGGEVIEEVRDGDGNVTVLRAYVPVREASSILSAVPFPVFSFSHWRDVGEPSDVTTPGTLAYKLVADARRRKGMPAQ